MDQVVEVLSGIGDRLLALAPQLMAAFLVVSASLVLGQVLAKALDQFARRRAGAHHAPTLLSRIVQWLVGLIGLILALQILGLTAVAASLLATGGLVAVVLGFAFREIGQNLLAGLFLGVSRSFEVGDLIESTGQLGEVRSIELRQVWLRSADGRDIFVPSAQIFSNVLINYTKDGLRRGDFAIGLDYGNDMVEARRVLLSETENVEGVLKDPAPAIRMADFTPQYCELKVFFWVNIDSGGAGLAEVRSQVMDRCLAALKRGGYALSSDVSTAVALSDRR